MLNTKYTYLVLISCLCLAFTGCSNDMRKQSINSDKGIIDETNANDNTPNEKQKINNILKILGKDSLSLEIKEYNILEDSKDEGRFEIETIFKTDEKNIESIIDDLKDYCNTPFYYKYNDEMAEGDYGINLATYLCIKPFDENQMLSKYFGECYDEFFENQYFKRNIDIEAFERFIDENKEIQPAEQEMYKYCKRFALLYRQLSAGFMKKIDSDYFEYENFFQLKNLPKKHFIYDEANENEGTLYYWFDTQTNCNVYLQYSEKIEDSSLSGQCLLGDE